MEKPIDVRFPIGKIENALFSKKEVYSPEAKLKYVHDMVNCPSLVHGTILDLDDEQVNTPYRQGGWTPKQIVHHLADSHMNGLMRFKLALTEETPVIKTYDQSAWAQLPDRVLSVDISLAMLTALHRKWVEIMQSMDEADWQKKIYHPEQQREIPLWDMMGTYAWHGKHHAGQIMSLRTKMGW